MKKILIPIILSVLVAVSSCGPKRYLTTSRAPGVGLDTINYGAYNNDPSADKARPATINTTNHTVTIQVAYGTNVTSLTPSITVSTGATISPASGETRNFSNPVTYTVSNSGVSQTWTVTVTVASAPPQG